ncbi:hypothetical protein CLOM621_07575 [Clostridium sp. M62/1]|nr:hypothetical protein CLOM621_07575 [Clostridium sp. M62/1]
MCSAPALSDVCFNGRRDRIFFPENSFYSEAFVILYFLYLPVKAE